jgi:hypothetical protein
MQSNKLRSEGPKVAESMLEYSIQHKKDNLTQYIISKLL